MLREVPYFRRRLESFVASCGDDEKSPEFELIRAVHDCMDRSAHRSLGRVCQALADVGYESCPGDWLRVFRQILTILQQVTACAIVGFCCAMLSFSIGETYKGLRRHSFGLVTQSAHICAQCKTPFNAKSVFCTIQMYRPSSEPQPRVSKRVSTGDLLEQYLATGDCLTACPKCEEKAWLDVTRPMVVLEMSHAFVVRIDTHKSVQSVWPELFFICFLETTTDEETLISLVDSLSQRTSTPKKLCRQIKSIRVRELTRNLVFSWRA